MALNTKSGGGNGSGKEVERGVYVDKATIADVGVLTGQIPQGWQRPIGLGIELFLEKPGLDFQPKLRLFGEPKFENGVPTGWGSAFPVRDALAKVAGYDGDIGDDLTIPDAVLLSMIGKEIHYIRFVYGTGDDGKAKYATFREVDTTEAGIIKKWNRSRQKGYPKDYNPGVLDSNGNGTATATATVLPSADDSF